MAFEKIAMPMARTMPIPVATDLDDMPHACCSDPVRSKILIELSWEPPHYDHCMIFHQKSRPIDIRRLRSRFSAGGTLANFPVEITHKIFSHLDMQSLGNLRLVNYGTKRCAEALPEFRHVVEHASCALRVIKQVQLLPVFSVAELFDTMCETECTGCGAYAPFLLLPACTRCCFHCLSENLEMRVITPSAARAAFGLSQPFLNKLPRMRSIKGTYDLDGRQRSAQSWLVSVTKAQKIGLEQHRQRQRMSAHVEAVFGQKQARSEVKLTRWSKERQRGRESRRPRRTLAPDEILSRPNDQFRYMGATPFPSFDRRSQIVETGLWCRGCTEQSIFVRDNYIKAGDILPLQDSIKLEKDLRTAYAEDDILAHFETCPGALRLWDQAMARDAAQADTCAAAHARP
ncbi:MAG: hypothetical protein M1825_005321 [Sarcosagium campestre]|nr:MAG: hypothetical protein M1825_005321 [Sarcosagium campestre]